MTRDEILAMEPGREMDVLVMEIRNPWDESRCRICGWPLKESVEKGCVVGNCSERPPPWRRADTPAPVSTDIYAALPLADEMMGALDAQDRTWVLHRDRDKWAVSEMYHDDLIPIAIGAEAPEAITKAWLIWRESEND